MSNSIYRNAADIVMSATNSFDVNCHDGATKGLKLGGILVTSTQAEIDRACKVNQRLVNLTTASLTMSQAVHDGRILTVNKADGTAITLPNATGSGMKFTIFIGTTITSNTTTITCGQAADNFVGFMSIFKAATAITPFIIGGANSVITLDGSTRGGSQGDMIELIDVATNVWYLNEILLGSGVLATNVT